jgi:hypothetical protein
MPLDLSQFLSGLSAARAAQLAAAIHATDVFAEHVIGDAQEITPVKFGTLQASGTTQPIKVEGESVTKELGFNTDYAAAVHENLEAHHDVGQAKFLTTSLQQNAGKLGPFIANAVKGATG